MPNISEIKRFTVRVYGILLDEQGKVLLSDEKIGDFAFTKFPGGGLEFGEGTIDCIKREYKEETGLDVDVERHLYTSDFFIHSKIDPEEQVIGIYYLVKADAALIKQINTHEQTHDFRGNTNTIKLIWVSKHDLFNRLTFAMDKRAAEVFISAL